MRATSPGLAAAFAAGVRAEGRSVIEIGLASTDLLYYASGSLDLPGAMFTASHNPAQYNGIKMCRAGARPIGQDSGLAEIRERAAGAAGLGRRPVAPASRPGPPSGATCSPTTPRYLRTLVDLSRHPAAEGGRRRRQRHGRLHRSDRARRRRPVAAAAGDRAALLRAGRHLPQPRGQPARPGEPGRPAARGASSTAPTSGWPSTATPTAASSSTSAASRSRRRRSPPWWPPASWPSTRAPR